MSRFYSLLLSSTLLFASPFCVAAADAKKPVKAEIIEFKDLPEVVKAGFEKAAPGGEVVKVQKLPEEPVRYRVFCKVKGKDVHFLLDAEGNRLAHPKKNAE